MARILNLVIIPVYGGPGEFQLFLPIILKLKYAGKNKNVASMVDALP